MKEKIVRFVAGVLILISVLLSVYISTRWLWLAGFVGFNLLQSSITSFCPLEIVLKKLGMK